VEPKGKLFLYYSFDVIEMNNRKSQSKKDKRESIKNFIVKEKFSARFSENLIMKNELYDNSTFSYRSCYDKFIKFVL
jgi:hypothetical protein